MKHKHDICGVITQRADGSFVTRVIDVRSSLVDVPSNDNIEEPLSNCLTKFVAPPASLLFCWEAQAYKQTSKD